MGRDRGDALMERKITVCDRCSNEIKPPDLRSITLHAHHDQKIDLCKLCRDTLTVWLAAYSTSIPAFGSEWERKIEAELCGPDGFPRVFD